MSHCQKSVKSQEYVPSPKMSLRQKTHLSKNYHIAEKHHSAIKAFCRSDALSGAERRDSCGEVTLVCLLKINNGPQIEYPSVEHRPPLFKTLIQHTDHTFSAPFQHLFNTKNSSVQHTSEFKTPFSSTTKTVSSTQETVKGELNWRLCWTEWCVEVKNVFNWRVSGLNCRLVLNWGVFWLEDFSLLSCRFFGVELTGVLNLGFFVRNWRILGAEKEWPFCVELMCWTEGVWNWG